MASNHTDPDFHPGESRAQNQWSTSGQWDTRRREQLLWKETTQMGSRLYYRSE
jgi:hypothetical protein